MAAARFAAWMAAGFLGLEVFSYAMHRWVFHGILWRIHRTHHVSRHGRFEWNDGFSVLFAGLAIGLLWAGFREPFGPPWFALGAGITAYGGVYFVVHDLFTHRRFAAFASDNRALNMLRRAHLRHHQSAELPGQEPYGLFLVPFREHWRPPARRSDHPPEADAPS